MKHIILVAALGAALAAACSGPASTPVAEPVALVTLADVKSGDLPETVSGYGSVEFDPSKQHTINAEIEARVLEIMAVPGDTVEKDQIVLRLGPSSVAGVEMARARRDAVAAQAAADRANRLREDGLASDADVEAAETNARDLAALAASLENRTSAVRSLRAPIAGVVDAVLVEPGDLVAPGLMIARLASADAIQARIGIEIEDASRLKPGDAVSLSALDASSAAVETVIRAIDTRVDPGTRMANALVAVPAGQGFLPGEAVRAEIVVAIHEGALFVPRQAVFRDETGTYVFVADKALATLTRVETGLTSGNRTEIISGLTAGQSVVTDGAAILSDGMKLRTGAAQSGPAQ